MRLRAEDRDCDGGESYEVVAEDALAREAGNDFGDHAHRRQNHDVDGGMGVEPEEMLEKQWIAAEFGIEDSEVQSAFGSDQHNRDGDDRRTQKLNNAGCVVGPDEERQTRPCHAWRAHAVDGDHEVQASEDGRKSDNENRQTGLN